MTLPRSAAEVLSRIDSNRSPRPTLETEFIPPGDSIEETVADIWEEVMKIDQIGANDNFFALGGDSLQMTQIASRLIERCDVEVTFAEFYENPSIRQLAVLMRSTIDQTA